MRHFWSDTSIKQYTKWNKPKNVWPNKGRYIFLRCNVHFVTEFSVASRTGILFFAFFWWAKAWSARISLTWKTRKDNVCHSVQATYYSVAPVFIAPYLPQLRKWYNVTKPPPLSGHFLSCSIIHDTFKGREKSTYRILKQWILLNQSWQVITKSLAQLNQLPCLWRVLYSYWIPHFAGTRSLVMCSENFMHAKLLHCTTDF